MKSDIEIAQAAAIKPISEIAAKLSLDETDIEQYGRYKCKLRAGLLSDLKHKENGRLILVSAMHPTPGGEGKTTTSVGLADGLSRLGYHAMAALREPSLGPVFGMKGGAAGGGYAQVIPMEDINLHFTGDLHAIGAANNLLAAMVDNHIYQGNALEIDPACVCFKRAIDMNDRQLREIECGLGKKNGTQRYGGFEITAASEIMAILCLAEDMHDLKERLSRIVVGYTFDKRPVLAEEIGAAGAMAALLRDAMNPNLVQTLEATPVLIHGGPFANIAHGCNSLVATRLALKLSDYVVTEAGFGADLGAEKFLDIKCKAGGIWPDVVVIVATVRALKYHGGQLKDLLHVPNMDALNVGKENLRRHIENMRHYFKLPVVVAVNRFSTDTQKEISAVLEMCRQYGAGVSVCTAWAEGGRGAEALAGEVIAQLQSTPPEPNYLYENSAEIEEKLKRLTAYYGGSELNLTQEAKQKLEELKRAGFAHLPICMAKTQYSFSDNPKAIGCPTDFDITVRDFKLSAGAGFIVALTGNVMTMPGLPSIPSAVDIDVDECGTITGLF